MTCVDTSVLIACSRDPSHPLHSVVHKLAFDGTLRLCGPVWLEFIGGFRNAARRCLIAEQWRVISWLPTPDEAFETAAELVAQHRGIGHGDALIAASCILAGASLLTLDAGFDALRADGLRLH